MGLYFLTSLIVALVLPWLPTIIQLFLGEEYTDGIFTIILLFMYPVHQCIGQIAGSFLYAVEFTKPQSLIGCIFMLTSLLSSYILLSPINISFFGYNLGSVGLAVNIVVMNFIFTNISLFYIYNKFKWKKNFSFQFVLPIFILVTISTKLFLDLFIESFFFSFCVVYYFISIIIIHFID